MKLKKILTIFFIGFCSIYFYNSKTLNTNFDSENILLNTAKNKIQSKHHLKNERAFTLEESGRVENTIFEQSNFSKKYSLDEQNQAPVEDYYSQLERFETEQDLKSIFELLNEFEQGTITADTDLGIQIEKVVEKLLSSNKDLIEKTLSLVASNMDAPNSYTIRHILYKLAPEEIKSFALDLATIGSHEEKLIALRMISESPKEVKISPSEIENILLFSEKDSSLLFSTISALHLDNSDESIDRHEIIVERLKDLLTHTTQREKALTMLSDLKFNDLGLQNQVIDALNDDSTAIQHAAINTLSKNGKNHPVVLEVLIEKMQNQNTSWMVRAAAWSALSDFPLDTTNKELLEDYRSMFSGEVEMGIL